MKYRLIYRDLMERAAFRGPIDVYTERHHRIPRCLGGTDAPANLVHLTAREHFVAHLLLVKMYPDHHGLLYGALMLGRNPNGGLLRSREVARLRERHASRVAEMKRGKQYGLGHTVTEEHRAILRATHLGKRHRLGHKSTPEHVAKIKAALNGRKLSPTYSTGEARVRGVSERLSGGRQYFVVRRPAVDGVRAYAGTFETLEKAKEYRDVGA